MGERTYGETLARDTNAELAFSGESKQDEKSAPTQSQLRTNFCLLSEWLDNAKRPMMLCGLGAKSS